MTKPNLILLEKSNAGQNLRGVCMIRVWPPHTSALIFKAQIMHDARVGGKVPLSPMGCGSRALDRWRSKWFMGGKSERDYAAS